MPTAYTILFLLLILVAAATWIIPAGSYDYVDGVPVAGRTTRWSRGGGGGGGGRFLFVWDGGGEGGFFILMVGGFLGVVMKTGAVDAGVGNVIRLLGGREKWLIPILMLLFGLGGTTYGMWEETMAFLSPADPGVPGGRVRRGSGHQRDPAGGRGRRHRLHGKPLCHRHRRGLCRGLSGRGYRAAAAGVGGL